MSAKEEYYVVQPIMSEGPERWTTAIHISTHRTAEAAYKYINKNIKTLKNRPEYKDSYFDWHVVDKDYEPVFVEP